jgi:hypothetical protein
MAFPATYNINYYKGDTLEFKIYPKDNSGASFDLSLFNSVKFTIANKRGADAEQFSAYASISVDTLNNISYLTCAILPGLGNLLSAGTQYVYDIEITKTGSPYPYIYTVLNGTVTVTEQITGAV